MVNPIAAGFLSGGILARSQGPKATIAGGLAFAAFSAAIDMFLRREPPGYILFANVRIYVLIRHLQRRLSVVIRILNIVV